MCTENILIFLYLIILNIANFFLLKLIKKKALYLSICQKCNKTCKEYNYQENFFYSGEFFKKSGIKQDKKAFSSFFFENLGFLNLSNQNSFLKYYSSLLTFQFLN